MFKRFVPGVGKLFVISGFGLGLGIMLGRHHARKLISIVKGGLSIIFYSFIFSFVFIDSFLPFLIKESSQVIKKADSDSA